jgi:hypothetical protein
MNITLSTSALGSLTRSSLFAFNPAAEARQCRLADTAGDYGCTSNGTIVSPTVGPFIAVGREKRYFAGTTTAVRYCPDGINSRAEMSAFLVKTFALP